LSVAGSLWLVNVIGIKRFARIAGHFAGIASDHCSPHLAHLLSDLASITQSIEVIKSVPE
tara:strand:- start:406 stop:585 length:180 start_codon:yes stop_codon:yes gene_type:complete